MLQLLPPAIGKRLRKVRPGIRDLLMHAPGIAGSELSITLTSPTFRDGCKLPTKYTVDGAGISPPLHWRGVPSAAANLVLVIEDADSPTVHPLVHAVAYNLSGDNCRRARCPIPDAIWHGIRWAGTPSSLRAICRQTRHRAMAGTAISFNCSRSTINRDLGDGLDAARLPRSCTIMCSAKACCAVSMNAPLAVEANAAISITR